MRVIVQSITLRCIDAILITDLIGGMPKRLVRRTDDGIH